MAAAPVLHPIVNVECKSSPTPEHSRHAFTMTWNQRSFSAEYAIVSAFADSPVADQDDARRFLGQPFHSWAFFKRSSLRVEMVRILVTMARRVRTATRVGCSRRIT
jgi:hypothetical protein